MSAPGREALVGLQRRFLAHLRGLPDDDVAVDVDCGTVSRTVGLRIYANAYTSRLCETLEQDHPMLGQYLGDSLWDRLCTGYIAAHPSRVRSLRDFGALLPDWLMRAEQFAGQPQISELALFERRLLDSFDGPEDPQLPWSAFESLPASHWPGLRLRFHAGLRVHAARWNSVAIWQALKDGDSPPAAQPIADGAWAMWRDRDRVGRFRSLDQSERDAFEHCRGSGDFASLCELLAARLAPTEVPVRALAYLHNWCEEGWIACLESFSPSPRSPS